MKLVLEIILALLLYDLFKFFAAVFIKSTAKVIANNNPKFKNWIKKELKELKDLKENV